MMPSIEPIPRETRILNATAKLIAHYGYDKTTVSDIANEAGVSKGAVYLHWASKEALFDALLSREMFEVLNDTLARIQADPQGGTLGGLYRHALLAFERHPLLRALYTRDARVLGDYVHRQDVTRYTQRFLFGREFVCQMQAAGLIRKDLDAAAVAYWMGVLAYGFMGISTIYPPDEAPSVDQVAPALVEFVERGLADPGGDSAAGKQAIRALTEVLLKPHAAPEPSSDLSKNTEV